MRASAAYQVWARSVAVLAAEASLITSATAIRRASVFIPRYRAGGARCYAFDVWTGAYGLFARVGVGL